MSDARSEMEQSPKERADTVLAIRLISQSVVNLTASQLRAVPVTAAILDGPLPSAYSEAMATGNTDLARAYVTQTAKFLAPYIESNRDPIRAALARILAAEMGEMSFATALHRRLRDMDVIRW